MGGTVDARLGIDCRYCLPIAWREEAFAVEQDPTLPADGTQSSGARETTSLPSPDPAGDSGRTTPCSRTGIARQ